MEKDPVINGVGASTSCGCSAVGVSKKEWYVAIVKNNTELSVQKKLLERGIESYVPTQQKIVITSKSQRKQRTQVIIPTIVFIFCSEEERKNIVALTYINRFMTNCSGTRDEFKCRPLAIIPNEQIEKLKFIVGNSENPIGFKPVATRIGDTVKVVRGCLKGLIGNVEKNSPSSNLLIRIDALGFASVEIDPLSIEILKSVNTKKQ